MATHDEVRSFYAAVNAARHFQPEAGTWTCAQCGWAVRVSPNRDWAALREAARQHTAACHDIAKEGES